MSYVMEYDRKVQEFKREMVRAELGKCSEAEVAMFNRMYGSIERIDESKMRNAYDQCCRTNAKHGR